MRLEKLVPKYAWVPIISIVASIFVTYHISMFVISDSARHYIHMAVDDAIPFVPFFVVFYVLSFAQWACSWIMTGRESRQVCFKYAKAEIIAKLLCLVCFIVYPTIIERPSLIVSDFFTWLMNTVWTFDRPVNCLPSMHVLSSAIAFGASFEVKKAGNWYRWLHGFMFVMCAASVVFTKQHYFIDIPAGIIVALAGSLIAGKMNNERFLWVR